jgi:hypothetical protein
MRFAQFLTACLRMTVAVLRHKENASSVLAAPLMHILFYLLADVAGRNNSGAKQIGKRKSAPQGNQQRALNLGVMR